MLGAICPAGLTLVSSLSKLSHGLSLCGLERSKEREQIALEREPSGEPRYSPREYSYPDLTRLTSAAEPLALQFTVTAIVKKNQPNLTQTTFSYR